MNIKQKLANLILKMGQTVITFIVVLIIISIILSCLNWMLFIFFIGVSSLLAVIIFSCLYISDKIEEWAKRNKKYERY